MACLNYETRLSQFNRFANSDLVNDIASAIKRGRITLCEHMFLESFMASLTRDAKADVNNLIWKMDQASLEMGDINAVVWGDVSKVLKGHQLHES